MQFTQIPSDYSPLHTPLLYSFSDSTPRTFDLALLDLNMEETVGAKRYIDTQSGAFDAAPYLRRRVSFHPQRGSTGFVDAWDRTVPAAVEIDGIRTPARNFLPCKTAAAAPALLTTVPWNRLIARGECEELTLLTDSPCTAAVDAFRNGETRTTSFTARHAGLILFRIDTADFPDADVLTLRFDRFSRIVYEITTPTTEGRRLAWRTLAGSLEHYTFPVVKEELLETERSGFLAPDGTRPGDVRTSHRYTLLSAYEPSRMLAALGEIPSSPQVWLVEEGRYTPVEVMTASSAIRRHGSLCNLELQLRIPTAWN